MIQIPIFTGHLFGGLSPPSPPGTIPPPAGLWVVPTSSASNPDAGDLTARPNDFQFFAFDFGDLPEITGGAAIVSALMTATTISIIDQSFSTYQCGGWFSGGVADVDYTVTATVVLDDGSELTPQATYRVRA